MLEKLEMARNNVINTIDINESRLYCKIMDDQNQASPQALLQTSLSSLGIDLACATGVAQAAGFGTTPTDLAAFVARHVLAHAKLPANGPIRILDPAVGDGSLLLMLLQGLTAEQLARVQVDMFDRQPEQMRLSTRRLQAALPALLPQQLQTQSQGFLHYVLEAYAEQDLFSSGERAAPYDIVVANPPPDYVEYLNPAQLHALAKPYGLSGRIDLYYLFILAISRVLAPQATIGMITSNRFMSTKTGHPVRCALLESFALLHIWDLGDSDLFESPELASFLPSVLLAHGLERLRPANLSGIRCSSLYACNDTASQRAPDALAALEFADNTVLALADGRNFRVRHGRLDNQGQAEGIWRLATSASDQWLHTVHSRTWAKIERIGMVRTGLKLTHDKLLIRADWDSLHGGAPELLRPLQTRHCAQAFRAQTPSKASQCKQILYPYESTSQGVAAVDLSLYPRSRRFLEQHRAQLEARSVVQKNTRQWYELSQVQDPAAWVLPKLVFCDTEQGPQFWLDQDGGVVSAECHWLRCEKDAQTDWLWLALAVANSSFIGVWSEQSFDNKLHANKRGFQAQQVEQFPLPHPEREEVKALIALCKQVYASSPSAAADALAEELDSRVWLAFGLQPGQGL